LVAAYAAYRKAGMSKQTAATKTKQLTVDFDQRGYMGPAINALYAFSGANIQGNAAFLRALISPRGAAIGTGLVAFGALLHLLNMAWGGDDDDNGIPDYEQLPEWQLQANLILPGGVQIPAAHGWRVLPTIGRHMLMTAMGDEAAGDAAMHSMKGVIDSFNPIGGESNWLQVITPTALDPFVQTATNENWAGHPIAPVVSPFDRVPKPDHQRFFRSVGEPWKWIAKGMSDATGGDKIKGGALDVSPETLEHWWESFGGGVLRTFTRTAKAISGAVQGEPVPIHEVPFVRRVVWVPHEGWETQQFYDHLKRLELVEQYSEHYKEARLFQERLRFREDNAGILGARYALESADKKVREWRKEMRETDDEERRELLEDRIKRRIRQANSVVLEKDGGR
jgi:hypothetical protein